MKKLIFLTTIFKEENRKDKKTFLSFLSNYITVTVLYHTLIKCEDDYPM